MLDDATRAHAVSGLFTRSCPSPAVSSSHLVQEPWGLPEFSSVSLPACQDLRTPADRHSTPQPSWVLRMACQDVKTGGIRHKLIAKRYLHFRERDLPYGLPDALCTLAPSCSRVSPLRHGTNTRYGRAANPYPTGTFTRQETPSFARRDNDQAQPQPCRSESEAGTSAGAPCWATGIAGLRG